MAYKRNPMRSERMASLARYVLADTLNPLMTASEQRFERTLDDSANKRISIPRAFLRSTQFSIFILIFADGLVVYDKVIESHIMKELPLWPPKTSLWMRCLRGGDRPGASRKNPYSFPCRRANRSRFTAAKNDLIKRIAADPAFGMDEQKLSGTLDPKNMGRAPQQTAEYVEKVRREVVEPNKELLGEKRPFECIVCLLKASINIIKGLMKNGTSNSWCKLGR